VVNVLICGHPLVREKEERFWFPSNLMAVNSQAICGRTKETVIFGRKKKSNTSKIKNKILKNTNFNFL
jgi:hypothetical protein